MHSPRPTDAAPPAQFSQTYRAPHAAAFVEGRPPGSRTAFPRTPPPATITLRSVPVPR